MWNSIHSILHIVFSLARHFPCDVVETVAGALCAVGADEADDVCEAAAGAWCDDGPEDECTGGEVPVPGAR
jgi:hypothetical protein